MSCSNSADSVSDKCCNFCFKFNRVAELFNLRLTLRLLESHPSTVSPFPFHDDRKATAVIVAGTSLIGSFHNMASA